MSIPTIGIGAGVHCDGQVLVIYDLLGMNEEFRPKFVKRYDNLAVRIRTAVEQYITEVRNEQFPDEEHSFSKDAPRARERHALRLGPRRRRRRQRRRARSRRHRRRLHPAAVPPRAQEIAPVSLVS